MCSSGSPITEPLNVYVAHNRLWSHVELKLTNKSYKSQNLFEVSSSQLVKDPGVGVPCFLVLKCMKCLVWKTGIYWDLFTEIDCRSSQSEATGFDNH